MISTLLHIVKFGWALVQPALGGGASPKHALDVNDIQMGRENLLSDSRPSEWADFSKHENRTERRWFRSQPGDSQNGLLKRRDVMVVAQKQDWRFHDWLKKVKVLE